MRSFLLLSLLAGIVVVSAAPARADVNVGSPVIARPINDTSVGVIYLYLGGTQPVAGPGAILQWSFFDDEPGSSSRKVTPLLYELSGTNQWKVVAIGATRTSNGSGVQTFSFSAIAGDPALNPAKQYTVGFTHRGYTGAGASLVPDGGNSGVVDFTGYGVYTDRWAYAIGTANLGVILGTGGLTLDSLGFGGRIYSASFVLDGIAQGVSTYCTAGTSTNGCTPSIGAAGNPSAGALSGFTIQVVNVEGAKQGLFFYGVSGRAIAPWAPASSSFLCVKSPTQRMTLLSTGGVAGQCNGSLSIDWRAYLTANPGSLGAPFSAGVTVDAQAWYRDPPAAKTTNLSNALEFTTIP